MNIIKINRDQPFDPEAIFGEGWSIMGQSDESLCFSEIDTDKLFFLSSEAEIILRIKSSFDSKIKEEMKKLISLDAGVCMGYKNNPELIPEQFKKNGVKLLFSGTILGGKKKYFNFHWLSICWEDGQWKIEPFLLSNFSPPSPYFMVLYSENREFWNSPSVFMVDDY